jgi:hypothetical protein
VDPDLQFYLSKQEAGSTHIGVKDPARNLGQIGHAESGKGHYEAACLERYVISSRHYPLPAVRQFHFHSVLAVN